MNTWIRRIILAVVIAGVGFGVFQFFNGGKNGKKDEITYETGPVTRGDIRSFVTATGVIQPWKLIDIKSNVGGKVDRLFVDLGDKVKAGQLIALIDKTDPQAAAEQAQADLTSARAREDQARTNLTLQKEQTKAQIAAAVQAVASARARLVQAQANAQTQPILTEAEINQAKANLNSAQKAVNQARQSKNTLEKQLSTLQEVTIPLNIRSVQTNLNQAQANLDTMQAEYKRKRDLLSLGYVAKSDVEATYAQLATMKANVLTAQQRQDTLARENLLQVEEVKTRIEQAAASIEEAESRVEQSKAALASAQAGTVQNRIRESELVAAKAAVRQSERQLDAAKADENLIRVREQEILSAKSQIVRSEAGVDQANQNLSYTKITAPSDGVVLVKSVEQGTVVPSSRQAFGSTSALLQLGDISQLWVVCNVDETDIGQIRNGMKVSVKVDAYPSRLIDGKVIRIDPQAKIDQNVTLIPVTVRIDDPSIDFRPGMNAECEFIVDEATNVLQVPNEALKEADGVYKVQKLVAGKPEDIEVEVGLAGADVTEIRSGVEEGEQVITKTIVPEKAETTNPFGGPFGGRPGGGRPGGGGGGRR
jgi:HlyD family secretion protein